jgi:hypothetical protein
MTTLKPIQPRIVVYDNVDDSFDHITIIDTKNGDMYGASDQPFAPQGFGQFCGNLVDSYMKQTYGAIYAKRTPTQVKTIVLEQLAIADGDVKWLGVRVKDNETLPEGVQKYIKQIIE